MRAWCLAVGLVLAGVACGQQATPARPVLPPIAPGNARLTHTIEVGSPTSALAYSPRLGILAAATERGTIAFWPADVIEGVRAGAQTANVLGGHAGPVLTLTFAGNVLASGGADGKILLRGLPDGAMLRTLSVLGAVRAISANSVGSMLAAAGEDSVIQLWDPASGKPIRTFAGHTDWIMALAFSADDRLLASGGYDGSIKIWEVATGRKILDVTAHPPAAPNAPPTINTPLSLALSPDNKQLAVGGSDEQVHVLNIADGKYVRSLPGHTSSITSLVYHPSGKLLVSGSRDRTIRLWDPNSGQAIKTLEGHTAWVQGLALLAQRTRLASAGADGAVRFWDLR
jgi:WD40 repeat protein